jgi:hypothetical protein
VNKGIRWAIKSAVLASGLALLSAPGLASEDGVASTPDQNIEADRQSRESAKEANEEAVNDAVNAVIEATRLDLDIRLIGQSSITIAAGQ